jgi:hypothetical protein
VRVCAVCALRRVCMCVGVVGVCVCVCVSIRRHPVPCAGAPRAINSTSRASSCWGGPRGHSVHARQRGCVYDRTTRQSRFGYRARVPWLHDSLRTHWGQHALGTHAQFGGVHQKLDKEETMHLTPRLRHGWRQPPARCARGRIWGGFAHTWPLHPSSIHLMLQQCPG